MNRIKFTSINFNSLEELTMLNSSEDRMFVDNDKKNLYKIYNLSISKNKTINLLKIEKCNPIENVIWPHTFIYQKSINKAVGCIMPYILGTINLREYFQYFKDEKQLDNLVKNASNTLKNIHKQGIVMGDVSFYNILFDSQYNHYFCDFDSIKTDDHNYDVSGVVSWHFQDNMDNVTIDENFDRFSMLLSYLDLIFEDDIENVCEYDYDAKSEVFPILKDSKRLVLELKNKKKDIPNIPYLNEF